MNHWKLAKREFSLWGDGRKGSCSFLALSSIHDRKRLHHRSSHDQDCKAEKDLHVGAAGTSLTFPFQNHIPDGHTHTCWPLGVDRKAESVRKLNRDAACELYHSLILLALGLPHRCWRKNPTNVVAITYITQVVFVYLVRRFLNFWFGLWILILNSVLSTWVSSGPTDTKTKKIFHVFIDRPCSPNLLFCCRLVLLRCATHTPHQYSSNAVQ